LLDRWQVCGQNHSPADEATRLYDAKTSSKIEGKLELAREFYRDGYPLEKIIEKTGFTAGQIKGV